MADAAYIDGATAIVEVLAGDSVDVTLGMESFLSMHVDFADLGDRSDLAAALLPALRRCVDRGAVMASSTGMLLRRGTGVAARVAGAYAVAAEELDAAAALAADLDLPVERALIEVERARVALAMDVPGARDRLAIGIDALAALGLTWRASILGS